MGLGSSELLHVLATQTLPQTKPKRMRVTFTGRLPEGLQSKDIMLYSIGYLGAASGAGSAVEFAGPTIRNLSMKSRLSLSNLSIEMGARFGMIAPDDTTLEYLAGREFAPKGALWERAVAHWRTLPSEEGSVFDREERVDIAAIAPQITWGMSPQDVVGVDDAIPDPAAADGGSRRFEMETALRYMGLKPLKPIAGSPIGFRGLRPM